MKHTVKEVKLKNGAKGLFVHIPDATVMNFQFLFRAGFRFARPEVYEVAHLLEHMAFGANSRHKNQTEFENDFTKNGAYHNAYTSDNLVCYSAECADFEWERILDLQLLSIAEPKFNETELQAELGNIKSELTGYLNDYMRLLWPELQIRIGEQVLTLQDRLKLLPNITLDDVWEHYNKTHTAKNLRFVIAGNFSGRTARILELLENAKFETGIELPFPVDNYNDATPELIPRTDANNVSFGFSLVLPRRLENKESDAMSGLNHLLNGTMSSRIFGEARRRGLVYGIFSETQLGQQSASWDFGGEANAETMEKLFQIIVRELKKVADGEISEEEVNSNHSYALGRLQMQGQTVGATGNFYTGRYVNYGEIDDYDRMEERIHAISKSGMQKIAAEFLQNGKLALVAVGKKRDKKLIDDLGAKLEKMRNGQ
ncbi:MAG: insulinase family protein [Candidatus Nomurabacteria bacterium]|jgi:predicted Zn-dependent peptidase|nr:insulinase family protein [Candidatus Nomurabacteria bacterium]